VGDRGTGCMHPRGLRPGGSQRHERRVRGGRPHRGDLGAGGGPHAAQRRPGRVQDRPAGRRGPPHAEGAVYRTHHMGRHRNRAGRLWLVGDRIDLGIPFQVGHLLSIWGGEAINHAFTTRSAESRRLARVGTPTVVVALLDSATECSYAHPGIGLSAVRRVAGEEPGTSVNTTGHARARAHRGGPPAGLLVLGRLRASRRFVSHGS